MYLNLVVLFASLMLHVFIDAKNLLFTGYSFDSDTGNCYKLHTTPLNWTDAHAACRAERSYLAVINNQLEADFLANLTKSSSNQRVRGNYYRGIYHLGFHNKYDDGWQTVTGIKFYLNTFCKRIIGIVYFFFTN